MVTVTVYKDGKTWKAKWGDHDVNLYEFILGVGMAKKDKMLQLFGPFKPVITYRDTPDKTVEASILQVIDYIDKTYANE
jgi:hypothetical protein